MAAIIVRAGRREVILTGPDEDGDYGWTCMACGDSEGDYGPQPIGDTIQHAEGHLVHRCTRSKS